MKIGRDANSKDKIAGSDEGHVADILNCKDSEKQLHLNTTIYVYVA